MNLSASTRCAKWLVRHSVSSGILRPRSKMSARGLALHTLWTKENSKGRASTLPFLFDALKFLHQLFRFSFLQIFSNKLPAVIVFPTPRTNRSPLYCPSNGIVRRITIILKSSIMIRYLPVTTKQLLDGLCDILSPPSIGTKPKSFVNIHTFYILH